MKQGAGDREHTIYDGANGVVKHILLLGIHAKDLIKGKSTCIIIALDEESLRCQVR